ncbi:MAG: response regulator transcription factor [bacterium]
MSLKVLVVDDEPDVVDIIALNLKTAGFEIITAHDGAAGLKKARAERPALIILDLMLPNLSGFEVCKELKKEFHTAKIPIIMLTARTEEADRVAGLELGADDYVLKPFSVRELVLRVQSVLRRMSSLANEHEAKVMSMGSVTVDCGRCEAQLKGQPLILTATEFRLLAILMARGEEVQSRECLLNDVWGYQSLIDTRTVDTHIRRLREKLGPEADLIHTVRGVGYRMSQQQT